MAFREEKNPDNSPPYFDESLVIHSRLKEIERRQEEEKKEEKQYKDRQIRFTKWTVLFTGLLFLTSAVSNVISCVQTKATRESADAAKVGAEAAKSAADTASETLTEIKNGAKDIHDLAIAARDQAAASKVFANATRDLATSSQDSIVASRNAIYLEQRPWVGIEIVPVALPPNVVPAEGATKISTLLIVAHNTGRTPALKWRSQCCEKTATIFEEVVPDYDTLKSQQEAHISPRFQEFLDADPRRALSLMKRQKELTAEENARIAEEAQVIPPNGQWNLDISITGSTDHKFHHIVG